MDIPEKRAGINMAFPELELNESYSPGRYHSFGTAQHSQLMTFGIYFEVIYTLDPRHQTIFIQHAKLDGLLGSYRVSTVLVQGVQRSYAGTSDRSEKRCLCRGIAKAERVKLYRACSYEGRQRCGKDGTCRARWLKDLVVPIAPENGDGRFGEFSMIRTNIENHWFGASWKS